ncbi:protein FAM151B-like [Scleropages formosus]|uniref:Protein FAM151B-like n=1 Tax=Scleropages formosus TaxID=113540 RepID=A0A0P7XUE5_SCLFO|nr:protein FAM151B-like [Scleropages formosus]
MTLLEKFRGHLHGPVWINADILPGPGGGATDLDPVSFLKAVGSGLPGSVLSLGWTTNWERGYSWEMVREMEEVCRPLKQPVTFPVRATLLPHYSLTVWTGQADEWKVEDLLPYRQNIDKSRIYYDLLESQYTTLWKLPC